MSLKEILEKCYKQELEPEEALKLIATSFPKQYKTIYEYENDLEYLDIVIDVYGLVKLKNYLTNKQRSVLKYYLKNGYSEETKKAIRLDFKIKKGHLNQLNWGLTKKGFLKSHPTNNRSKIVSEDLIELRDTFLKDGVNLYTIIFNKI